MATHEYTRTKSGTVGPGSSYGTVTFTIPSFSVPDGESFTRYKITCNYGAAYTKVVLKNSGAGSWNTWYTNKSSISWSDGGSAKILLRNTTTSAIVISVTVTFETEDLPRYTITCQSGSHGSLTASRETAREGQLCTLYPVADTGYTFSYFSSSPTVNIGDNNKFTMPAHNVTVTAHFTNQTYAISVVSEDTSKGTVTGGGTYAYQSTVTIKATPKPGYKFVNWTKSGSGTIGNANSAQTTFTVGAGTGTVTAHFERSQSIIDYRRNGAFVSCYAKCYKSGAWHDCDVYYYKNGAWHKCSKV